MYTFLQYVIIIYYYEMLIIHLTIGIEFDTEYKQQEVISLSLYDPLHLARSERNLWWRDDAALDFHLKKVVKYRSILEALL